MWLRMLRATTSLPKQPLAFFIFHSAFLLTDHKNLHHDHCSSICNALLITVVIETFAICRFHWPWFHYETAPNSSNTVSPQELPHWIFSFHCRLLSSSENLRITITSVRSQPCFNAVQKVVGTPFPPRYTPKKDQQLDQVCRSPWKLQVSISHPEPVLRLFGPILSKWVSHL